MAQPSEKSSICAVQGTAEAELAKQKTQFLSVWSLQTQTKDNWNSRGLSKQTPGIDKALPVFFMLLGKMQILAHSLRQVRPLTSRRKYFS